LATKNVKVLASSADTWIEYNRSKGTTVKIENVTTTPGSVSETRNRQPATQPAAGAAAEVHLSELAAQLQSSGDTPPFDASRVAEIKQAIAEGRFTINAEAIADRLIAAASELVGSRQQT
jgi:negative regulator of flagellin synthesis FlgM